MTATQISTTPTAPQTPRHSPPRLPAAPEEEYCLNCGQPADIALPRPTGGANGFCWNCASTPNVLVAPIRPPDVDPAEWNDYLAYRLAVLDDEAIAFLDDEPIPYVVAQ